MGFVIWNLKSRKPFFQAALVKNSDKPLMVVILIVGAFLIPFPSVVRAANLLSKIGVDHVDETEEKATQMSEVRNASPRSLDRRDEFNEAEDDNEIFGRDREEKVDIYEPIWEEPSIGQEDSIDRSRGSDHRNPAIRIRSKKNCTDTSTDPTEEKIEQEFS